MKVYLADLVHGISLSKQEATVPLNIANIGAYLNKVFGDKVDLSLYKYPDELLSVIALEDKPTVLGMSLYAWNADLNRKVGQYIKTYYPEVLIVMGGPSMRQSPKDLEDFLRCNEWLDAYVMYEGERPFADILKYIFANGSVLKNLSSYNYKNIAFLEKDKFYCNLSSDFGDITELPSPYLTGYLDKFLVEGFVPLFETNRGCPFSCTFCTWGLSSLNKVRRFPIERVFAELDYVSSRYPNLPEWIFADANFGIFGRDVEIAKKIREIRKRTPELKEVCTWDAKNNQERNSQIAEILDRWVSSSQYSNQDMTTLAVQNLSPIVLSNIGRKNIHLKDLPSIVDDYHEQGIGVTTDVMYALPEETFEDAMETMRKCFDIGFDYLAYRRTLMLPGCEMETTDSREKFGLKTKFLIHRGSYGEYIARHGVLRAIESDETIVSSHTFSEDDALTFHVLTWLVYYGWNHGRLRPVLEYLMNDHKVNPADFLLEVINCERKVAPKFVDLISNIRQELRDTMFNSVDELKNYYSNYENWKSLLKFTKVEYKYNALLYSDHLLFEDLCCAIEHSVGDIVHDKTFEDLMSYTREKFIDIDRIADSEILQRGK